MLNEPIRDRLITGPVHRIEQINRKVIQEPRPSIESGRTEYGPSLGVDQVQFLTSSRHSHVTEATLLFNFFIRFEAS